jgi:hypothetical protein
MGRRATGGPGYQSYTELIFLASADSADLSGAWLTLGHMRATRCGISLAGLIGVIGYVTGRRREMITRRRVVRPRPVVTPR